MKAQTCIVTNRSPEAVFACMTSTAFVQEWIAPFRFESYSAQPEDHYREIQHTLRFPELRQVFKGVWGVGTTFTQSNELRSHPMEATLEITRYERPTVFALNVTTEVYEYQATWSFRPASAGTQVTLLWEQKFKGVWVNIVALLASFVAKERGIGSLQYTHKLKQYIENAC